jgi:hypothetical protein
MVFVLFVLFFVFLVSSFVFFVTSAFLRGPLPGLSGLIAWRGRGGGMRFAFPPYNAFSC